MQYKLHHQFNRRTHVTVQDLRPLRLMLNNRQCRRQCDAVCSWPLTTRITSIIVTKLSIVVLPRMQTPLPCCTSSRPFVDPRSCAQATQASHFCQDRDGWQTLGRNIRRLELEMHPSLLCTSASLCMCHQSFASHLIVIRCAATHVCCTHFVTHALKHLPWMWSDNLPVMNSHLAPCV